MVKTSMECLESSSRSLLLLFLRTVLPVKILFLPIEEDDVSRTISELPRHPDDARIVAVKLKRKLEYKNTHIEEFIRV